MLIEKQNPLITIVDYILHLSKRNHDFAFFERVLDAVVYELYLPDLMKIENCNVIEYLQDLKGLKDEFDDVSVRENSRTVEMAYKKLSNPNYPISTALHKLINIPAIQTIEGRDEKNYFN
jgi:hypothetical protein